MSYVELFTENLGADVEELIMFVTFCFGLIITVKDFRIGMQIYFLLFLIEFAAFYQMAIMGIAALNYWKPLIAGLISLVLLTFSLLIGYSKNTSRVIY